MSQSNLEDQREKELFSISESKQYEEVPSQQLSAIESSESSESSESDKSSDDDQTQLEDRQQKTDTFGFKRFLANIGNFYKSGKMTAAIFIAAFILLLIISTNYNVKNSPGKQTLYEPKNMTRMSRALIILILLF